jgi:alpha-D-ribose 1-methylphosphonate 5-triphosphate synthase subunit PhnG
MNRARRTRILVQATRELSRDLAEEVLRSHEVQELESPDHGLVMAKIRESARASLFYLGDVLITEAKVRIGEAVGIGLVAGDAPEQAKDLAVIDAAYNASLPLTLAWERRLVAEEAVVESEERSGEARIQRTLVSFESMDPVQA